MFVLKENSLNDSDSKEEYLCRQSIARAGFAFGDAPATFHWTQLINPLGDKKAAISAYETLLKAEPENKSALEGLAYIFQTLGDQDKCFFFRKKLRELDAQSIGIDVTQHSEVVDFLLAKTGLATQPDYVPSAYVAAHFDACAASFDTQLCEILEYKGHLLIEEACLQIGQFSDENKLIALDIGCGTGLTGQAINGLFDNIDAVDLSEKMLSIARERNVYRHLAKANYHDYLGRHVRSYNVITASDVLVYEGCLSLTFQNVYSALTANGFFIFTVEKLDEKLDEKKQPANYRLRNTGRYQHSDNYILSCVKAMGFTVRILREVNLRVNDNKQVEAYLFVIQKNA